jgi:hypothetical protein
MVSFRTYVSLAYFTTGLTCVQYTLSLEFLDSNLLLNKTWQEQDRPNVNVQSVAWQTDRRTWWSIMKHSVIVLTKSICVFQTVERNGEGIVFVRCHSFGIVLLGRREPGVAVWLDRGIVVRFVVGKIFFLSPPPTLLNGYGGCISRGSGWPLFSVCAGVKNCIVA